MSIVVRVEASGRGGVTLRIIKRLTQASVAAARRRLAGHVRISFQCHRVSRIGLVVCGEIGISMRIHSSYRPKPSAHKLLFLVLLNMVAATRNVREARTRMTSGHSKKLSGTL